MVLPIPISCFSAGTEIQGQSPCTHRERDSACPEEIAAGIDRKERKYYYSSLTDGKPRRRELKRLAKSQTEIWKQPGTESRSAETQASALITRLLIDIIFLQLLFTRIDYEISASSYSCSAPITSSTPHVIPLPFFFPQMCQTVPLLLLRKVHSKALPTLVCSSPDLPHKQIPSFSNTDSICPQPWDDSCLVLKAPQLSTEPSHGWYENLPNWDAQSPGKEEFVGTPTHSSPKPGHRALHTARR